MNPSPELIDKVKQRGEEFGFYVDGDDIWRTLTILYTLDPAELVYGWDKLLNCEDTDKHIELKWRSTKGEENG